METNTPGDINMNNMNEIHQNISYTNENAVNQQMQSKPIENITSVDDLMIDNDDILIGYRFSIDIKKTLRGLGLSIHQSPECRLCISHDGDFFPSIVGSSQLPENLIKPNDIIEAINETDVRTMSDIQSVVQNVPVGSIVTMHFVRTTATTNELGNEKSKSIANDQVINKLKPDMYENLYSKDNMEHDAVEIAATKKRKDVSNQAQILYAIANYLSKCTPCSETIQVLNREICQYALLQPKISWDGRTCIRETDDLMQQFGPFSGKNRIKNAFLNLFEDQETPGTGLCKVQESEQQPFHVNATKLLENRALVTMLDKKIKLNQGHSRLNQLIDRKNELLDSIARLRLQCARQYKPRGVVHRPLERLPYPGALRKTRFLKKTQGHTGFVYCTTVDPDGKYVVTGSDDTLIKVWSSVNGRLIKTLHGHTSFISDLRIKKHKNTLYLASCSTDLCIRVWNLIEGRCLVKLSGHTKTIENIYWAPKKFTIYSCANDGACCIWNVENFINPIASNRATGSLLASDRTPILLPHVCRNTGRAVEVNALALHQTEPLVVTGTENGDMYMWLTTPEVPTHIPTQRALSPGISVLSVGFKLGTNRLLNIIPTRFQVVSALRWDMSGRRLLVAAGVEGVTRVWEWRKQIRLDENGIDLSMMEIPTAGPLLNMRHDKIEAGSITTSSIDETVRKQHKRTKKQADLDAIAWSCDDRWVITAQSTTPSSKDLGAYWAHQIRVWDSYDNGRLVHILRKHRNRTMSLVAHPSNPRLCLSSGEDGQVLMWDIVAGRLVFESLALHETGIALVLDVVFLPENSSSADIVCSDSMGRLCFLGSGDERAYRMCPPAQFFKKDFENIVYDDTDNAIDTQTQAPLYLTKNMLLCDNNQIAYEFQPGIAPEHDVVSMVRRAENVAEQKQQQALRSVISILQGQDADIERRSTRDRVSRHGSRTESNNENTDTPSPIIARVVSSESTTSTATATTVTQPTASSRLSENARVATLASSPARSQTSPPARSSPSPRRPAAPEPPLARQESIESAFNPDDDVPYDENEDGDGFDDDDDDDAMLQKYTSHELPMESPQSTADNMEHAETAPQRAVRRAARRAQGKMRHVSAMLSADGDAEGEEDDFDADDYAQPAAPQADTLTEVNRWQDLASQFDREWLWQKNDSLPQLGESFVYCTQAHRDCHEQEMDRRVTSVGYHNNLIYPMYTPWLQANFKREWQYVHCGVREIRYAFPFEKNSLLNRNGVMDVRPYHTEPNAICMYVILQPLEFKAAGEETGPWKAIPVGNESSFFQIVLCKEHLGLYLVCLPHFDDSVRRTFTKGTPVKLFPYLTDAEVDEVENLEDPSDGVQRIPVKTHGAESVEMCYPWRLTYENEPVTEEVSVVDFAPHIIQEIELVMRTNEQAGPFRVPVDSSIQDLYKSMVPLPVDLSALVAGIRTGYYRTFEHLFFHVSLISSNCFTFNAAGTAIRKHSNSIVRLCNTAIVNNIPGQFIPISYNRSKSELTKKKLKTKTPTASVPVSAVKSKMPRVGSRRKAPAPARANNSKRPRIASASSVSSSGANYAQMPSTMPIYNEPQRLGGYGMIPPYMANGGYQGNSMQSIYGTRPPADYSSMDYLSSMNRNNTPSTAYGGQHPSASIYSSYPPRASYPQSDNYQQYMQYGYNGNHGAPSSATSSSSAGGYGGVFANNPMSNVAGYMNVASSSSSSQNYYSQSTNNDDSVEAEDENESSEQYGV